MNKERITPATIALIALALVLAGALAYTGYRYYGLTENLRLTIASYTAELEALNQTLKTTEGERAQLAEALYSEQQKNASFEEQIEELADTVGVLDKLSKTDPELLQKYSKVYFLNEHYIPDRLTKIDQKYVLGNNGKEQYIQGRVWPKLREMLEDAADDDITLNVVSAYRSFDEQTSVKTGYTVVYGSGANSFSAEQGYSEHQLGTTIDFATPTHPTLSTSFETTEAFVWLTENAYRYGFVLSYPPGNAYYQYEPWHWRYVGEELARKLDRDEKYFYDMDQRDIDAYLIELF